MRSPQYSIQCPDCGLPLPLHEPLPRLDVNVRASDMGALFRFVVLQEKKHIPYDLVYTCCKKCYNGWREELATYEENYLRYDRGNPSPDLWEEE